MNAPTRPMRRDAEANRRRLLDAASELFAERGLDVTLNDIAHHAGVGVGTAYRRFPNKEAVIDAVFEQRLEAVEGIAHEALRRPTPGRGWRSTCNGSCSFSSPTGDSIRSSTIGRSVTSGSTTSASGSRPW